MIKTNNNPARLKTDGRKKSAAIVAIALSLALIMGGVFAFTDFSQSFTNRFRGGADPDILLHDDFEPGVNKDVYVENTGKVPMIVRVQFAEYLQIGNTPVTGLNPDDKTTWVIREFYTAPAADGSLPSQNRHIWYMTGNKKVFKPGTGEMGSYQFTAGQTFPDGSVAKETLGKTPVMLMADYLANKAAVDAAYPDGVWVLDTDGWCYWTKALKPGEATSLLLDNVIPDPDDKPDDNYYYAIDVRLQASNLTEAYLLEYDITEGGKLIIDGIVNPPVYAASQEEGERFSFVLDTQYGISDGMFGTESLNVILNIDANPGNNFTIDWGDGMVSSVPKNADLSVRVSPLTS